MTDKEESVQAAEPVQENQNTDEVGVEQSVSEGQETPNSSEQISEPIETEESEAIDEVESKKSTPHWLDYKRGGTTKTGVEIAQIFGSNKKCFVYKSKSGGVRWEYDENLDCTTATAEAGVTLNQIIALLKDKAQSIGLSLAGHAIFIAISKSPTNDVTEEFRHVHAYIDEKAKEKKQVTYLKATTLGFLIYLVLGWWAAYFSTGVISNGIVGSIFGVAGAYVSVLQRFRRLEIGSYSEDEYIRYRGLTRLLLGVFFGIFIILAHHSKLALGTIENNFVGVLIFCFIAGLSERFVPEMMDSIANGSSGKKSKNDTKPKPNPEKKPSDEEKPKPEGVID